MQRNDVGNLSNSGCFRAVTGVQEHGTQPVEISGMQTKETQNNRTKTRRWES